GTPQEREPAQEGQGDPFVKAPHASAHAFFRGLTATEAGSVAASSFLLRRPATGRSNERWRRSAAGLARFRFGLAPPVPGICWIRLRFSVSAPPSDRSPVAA